MGKEGDDEGDGEAKSGGHAVGARGRGSIRGEDMRWE